MDGADIERLLDTPARRGPSGHDLTGPVTVLATAPTPGGGTRVDVTATRLVAVDPEDAALADISIPVPVQATLGISASGSLIAVDAPPADPATDQQARAYARNLIANGAVRGLTQPGPVRRGPGGPPTRPTHEVTIDDQGRRIIRRTGFSAGLDPQVQHEQATEDIAGGTTHD